MTDRDHSDLRDAAERLDRALEESIDRKFQEAEDPIKQVLVYRRDLKMRKGKVAAQCGHATWIPFLDRKLPRDEIARMGLDEGDWLVVPLTPEMAAWIYDQAFGKIVLTVETEEDLLRVYSLALEAGIPAALVTDAGRTEFKETCPACGGTGHTSTYPPRPQGTPQPTCSRCNGTGKVGVPTRTAVGLGPARASAIDAITGPDGAVPTRLP